MAFHKAKEECKWKRWKEQEETQLRKFGMAEEAILELHRRDWEDFNTERRYRERQADFPGYDALSPVELEEPEINDVQRLLDAIEDEPLLHIMLEADRETLQILLLRMMGYPIPEISGKLDVPEQTIYTRIRRLREKIKKVRESE